MREVGLTGKDYLEAVTRLLVRSRGEEPLGGLYDAGDPQWWWHEGDYDDPARQVFWFDESGSPLACLLIREERGQVDADVLWVPSWEEPVRERILPEAAARLATLPAGPDGAVVRTEVRKDDRGTCDLLEAEGFRPVPDSGMVQTYQRPDRPPEFPLPEGFGFADDRQRPPGEAHPLAKRNGARVAERLRECSLYRPELDLRVQAASGEVAAYCVCWFDPENRIGLFEPVRTEDAYQGRGIGKALMTEGIRRLMDAGAVLVKVAHKADAPAATALYRAVGFRPVVETLLYALDRSPA